MDFKIDAQLISQFEEIYVHPESVSSEVAQRFIKLFPKNRVAITEKPPYKAQRELSAQEFDRSKRVIFIRPFEGQFFKRCPGATQKKTLACCNYYVLNLGQQCNMNCSYCYLQTYLNTPVMLIYSNIEKALNELREIAKGNQNLPMRVGTGEVIDSLSMDELTLYSRKLIEFFRAYPNWVLEFKTKSSKVDQFLDCAHSSNVWVSWSINPQSVITSEEHGTASLKDRLDAAVKCADKKYPIAFHIDPMIYFEGWEGAYTDLVDQITSIFKPEQVKVISIGSLRFQPEQRHMMRERFGLASLVNQGEMFPSEGAKWRYDASLRNTMYRTVVRRFQENSPDWKTFLCMETPENWIQSYEKLPMQVDGLRSFFRPIDV